MEHKAQTHFEGLLRVSLLESSRECDAPMYLAKDDVRHVGKNTYTAVNSESCRESKPPQIVRYAIRVNRTQAERVAAPKAELNARSIRGIRLTHHSRDQPAR